MTKTQKPKPLRFRDLAINDRFEFVPNESTRYSGLARGPWIKVSARIYKHESDARLSKVKIGTINCEVDKLGATIADEN